MFYDHLLYLYIIYIYLNLLFNLHCSSVSAIIVELHLLSNHNSSQILFPIFNNPVTGKVENHDGERRWTGLPSNSIREDQVW
ncbi:hypothetical protein L6452_21487 [Arctium lappa]|uniref:Uncharacterized protein n=1 Tax=Arctium lappa TaxID=4217 RepID=A0ACB9AX74_ARCLA|nr:hypothetical protein L6452_21487 [Arctium lappa]